MKSVIAYKLYTGSYNKGSDKNEINFVNKETVEFANDIEADYEYYNIVKPNLVKCFNKKIQNYSVFDCPLYKFFDTVNRKPGMISKIKTVLKNDLENKGYTLNISNNNDKIYFECTF